MSPGGVPELRTPRLLLRGFTDADREPFAALNADPVVMEHFVTTYDRARCDAYVDRILRAWAERGWGLWALEQAGTGAFIGYTGLAPAEFDAPFTPAVEVGWRLTRAYWGQGYASEAARESLRFGFEDLGLPEVVSFTAASNERSWRVMERIGMVRDRAGGFEHPAVPPGHRLRPHVLYRLPRERWGTDVFAEEGGGASAGARSGRQRPRPSTTSAPGSSASTAPGTTSLECRTPEPTTTHGWATTAASTSSGHAGGRPTGVMPP